ncbi:MAG: hypothetical protein QXI09_03550 [Candidatus Aenigmatarchaeota archaeon]
MEISVYEDATVIDMRGFSFETRISNRETKEALEWTLKQLINNKLVKNPHREREYYTSETTEKRRFDLVLSTTEEIHDTIIITQNAYTSLDEGVKAIDIVLFIRANENKELTEIINRAVKLIGKAQKLLDFLSNL